jgi:hypothetical protein
MLMFYCLAHQENWLKFSHSMTAIFAFSTAHYSKFYTVRMVSIKSRYFCELMLKDRSNINDVPIKNKSGFTF